MNSRGTSYLWITDAPAPAQRAIANIEISFAHLLRWVSQERRARE